MKANELKEWRERTKLTQQQLADTLGITRTTIQNWESGATPIPQTVDMSCELLEPRLKQRDPNIGPVTLVYSDGPMFINPYGPRNRVPSMHQEPYPTNTAALAQVQKLWGRNDFHNAFILEESGKPLWNILELGRVVDGSDTDAPTVANLLRTLAKNIKINSANITLDGSDSPDSSALQGRQQAIETLANELEGFATTGFEAIAHNKYQVESILLKLRSLGTKALDSLVINIEQAFLAIGKEEQITPPPEDRLYYRGFEITWPSNRMFSDAWRVNVASNNPHLLMRLSGQVKVIKDFKSLEGAIQQAMHLIDNLLRCE